SRDMALATPDLNTIKEARRIVAEHEKAIGYEGGSDWEGPVECSTFAAHLVPFRIGIDRPGTDDTGEPLYLIVAASLEEISQDIWEATRWVLWISLILCVGAAVLALLPATLLTRPLVRITRAAQRLAEGDFATDLPVKSPGEIGELANSF